MEEIATMNTNAIYRYKLTDELTEMLHQFAKVHQYDDRLVYKEAWTKWIEEHDKYICNETKRLNELGYEGSVVDKMYKSARYYYRKKTDNKDDEPIERKKYLTSDQDLLNAMDIHIIRNIKRDDYSPANGYSDFCKTNTDILSTEIQRMVKIKMTNDDIILKIKKTYKNRYFIISRNNKISFE
jgi:hypothetical protein